MFYPSKEKIKNFLKKAAILTVLFLAAFFIGFYLVNLNVKPSPKVTTVEEQLQNENINAEIKKRLGSTDISMESYAEWAVRFDLFEENRSLDEDKDSDGLPNYLEYVHGTNPLKADSDGDGFSDKKEIENGYDPDASGDIKPLVLIHIAKIGVDAPMVWTQSEDEKTMLTDLEKGIGHFYKTAAPGQKGNMVLSGHSSNLIWKKGNYNYIFEKLNDLNVGDDVTVRTIQQNGRTITYHYAVTEKFITTASDERIFASTETSTITLSTCWPIGTNLKRIIVKGEIMK